MRREHLGALLIAVFINSLELWRIVLPDVVNSLRVKDGMCRLPLRLDLLPAVLQYLLSTNTGIEEHVAYLSLERLCMGAIGEEQLLPAERYATSTRSRLCSKRSSVLRVHI
eukprot:6817257-Prymnesium_polylepis.1